MKNVNLITSSRRLMALAAIASGVAFPLQSMMAAPAVQVVQQSGVVKGQVVDASGEPVIGATVKVAGSKTGTVTDLDGNFTLQAAPGATVEVSYIGYKTKSLKATAGKMKVSLEDDNQALNEVVVVGYGVQKKSDVTGSVTSVGKDRLEKLPVTNVLQAVQGAAAGVTITQTSSIPGDAPDALVRGQNSINANSGPYIVVDVVPINKTGGSLNDIAPSDIESMEILKDASATAIYGTNGANGVILITTKHGKSGKPTIKYSGYVGFEDFSHKLKFCDGDQIIQRYKDYIAINPGETMYNDNVKYANEAENYEKGIQTDWLYDEASQTGIITDHNVSIAGGAERVRYYVSGDYLSQKGVLKGFNYKLYSLRTNVDMDVTDYLKGGTNTYIASHNRDGGRVNFLNAEAMSPWGKMYNDDGSYCIYPMASEQLWTNPMIGTNKQAERRQWNVSINGFAEVDFGHIWKPLAGLKYKLNAGFSYAPKRENTYTGAAANDLNGTGKIFNAETQTYTIENIVSYAKDIDKHHFDLTGLYAASRKKYSESTAQGQKFINDDLGFNNLEGAESPYVKSYADLFGENNKYGTFPSVALGWNIANEKFMEKTQKWLNNLKLRLSYGKAGNEAIGVYQTLAKLEVKKFAMGKNSVVGLTPATRMGNSNLSWETTKTFNVGLDFGFLNNRINGNLDVYTSKTTGLLLKRNLPKISGYSDVYANMGETANKGVEFTINSKNIVTKDFTWATTLVFSWNKNEIKDLYGDGKDDLGNRWFIGQPIGVIYDYDMVGIWQEDEIERGDHLKWDPQAEAGDVKLADRNGDGKIDDNDRHVKGQTTPKWIGGMTNTFTYKGLSLSVFIQTVQGMMKNNNLIGMAGDEMGRRNTTTEIGYWTPENKSNEWRSLRKNSNKHGYGFAQKANFTRVKDITLSYTLPENIIHKAGLGGLTVYFTGRNLFTFTDWIGWDPETRQDGRGSGNWEDNYPMTKSYTFGINLTF